jgi:poly(A) polymerase
MEIPRDNKPDCLRPDAVAVVARLREAGHIAYFAGGCVRDMLLGVEPKDFDVATDAEPAVVQKLFSRTQAVGAAFGVILVRQNKSVVEVATFRADGPYSDGRRPDAVRFASAEEDARRRDFTINGLFFDPLKDEVIDYVGGRDDLANRRLRAIGDPAKRFEEDQLRLLRAVRFAARFDLTVDPPTGAAIRQFAPRLKGISPERIGDELRWALTPATRKAAWPLLWQLELAPVVFRLLPKVSASSEGLFLHVSPAEQIPFGLALAAAVLDVQLPADPRPLLERAQVHAAVGAMRKTLRISNEESEEMTGTMLGLVPLLADAEPTLAMKKRFLAEPTSRSSRHLLAALAKIGKFVHRAVSLEREFEALEKTDFAPPPLISGDDLTAAGMKPGPAFKRILDSTYDAQLEGRITTRQQAMEMAMKSTAPATE